MPGKRLLIGADTILAVILIAAIVYMFKRNRNVEPDRSIHANRTEAELLSDINSLNMQADIVKILMDGLAVPESPRIQQRHDGPRDTDETTGFITEINNISVDAVLVDMLLSPE